MNTVTLGHHRIGDWLWYSSFSNSEFVDILIYNKLPEGLDFKTHERFLALVTFLHESYHFIQDKLLGICAWVEFTTYSHTIATHAAYCGDLSFFHLAEDSKGETAFLDDLLYGSRLFDAILDAESQKRPHLAEALRPSYGLSGQDLLECHAAILAERRIARLLRNHPAAFSKAIMDDMASYFRPDAMPSCHKAFSLFNLLVGSKVSWDEANRQHPLYPHSPRASEYGLLLFIIDYALHACPLPAKMSATGSALQDVIPACRFQKLAGSILPCMVKAGKKSRVLLNEEYLHASFAPALEAYVNKCNAKAASWFRRSPRSFLGFNETTERWITLFKELSTMAEHTGADEVFKRSISTRLRSLELLRQNPLVLYATDILSLSLKLGIYPLFSTKEGIETAFHMFYLRTFEDSDHKTHYVMPENPYVIIDDHIQKEIFISLAKSLSHCIPFCCPLQRQYTFYPCPERRPECHAITNFRTLSSCKAGEILARFSPPPKKRQTP